MSEKQAKPADATAASTPAPATAAKAKWGDVWQVPLMAGAGAALVGGAVWAIATRPKPDVLADFKVAEALMSERKYGDALDTLSVKVLPVLSKGGLTAEQERGFYLMRARALYLGQAELGIERLDNFANVVEEYDRAEKRGASLKPEDDAYLSRSLLRTGDLYASAARARALPDTMRAERMEIVKELIEASLAVCVSEGDAAEAAGGHGEEHGGEQGGEHGAGGQEGAHGAASAPKSNAGGHGETKKAAAEHGEAGAPAAGERGASEHGASEHGASEHGAGEHGGEHSRVAISRESASVLALDLLTYLGTESALTPEDRLWALSRQSKLLISEGYYDDAATKILRTLPRLGEKVNPLLRADVLTTLARAYIGQGDLASAVTQLEASAEAAMGDHERIAEALVLMGQCREKLGELDPALESFESVLVDYPATRWEEDAILGAAGVQARLARAENDAELLQGAMEKYDDLVTRLQEKPREVAVAKGRVVRSLMDRFHEQYEAKEFGSALRFISLAESLFAPSVSSDPLSPDMLLGCAQVRSQIANEMLSKLGGGGAMSLAHADPATQREARDLLLAAGSYYERHAAKVAAMDTGDYASSLWLAADSFDRAGDTEEAVRQFQQFVADFPSDVRQPEAKFRLGEAYRARGEFVLASQVFQDLVDAGRRAGPFSDAAYVPLAQTLLADEDTGNDARAEELLVQVLSGRIGGTRAPAYRAALLELGDLCYRTARYECAIERYEEYLDRTDIDIRESGVEPGVAERGELAHREYRLADAYRLSARDIRGGVQESMAQSERVASERVAGDRIAKASASYERAIEEFEALPRRTAVQDLSLRNAYFYLADCAYDVRDYETAIRRYEAARERYPRDPAALVAMTQIVSAYLEQGQPAKASVANTKAKKFYESLPESVWDDPSLPMTRKEWERWLDAQGKLARGEVATGAEVGTGSEAGNR